MASAYRCAFSASMPFRYSAAGSKSVDTLALGLVLGDGVVRHCQNRVAGDQKQRARAARTNIAFIESPPFLDSRYRYHCLVWAANEPSGSSLDLMAMTH